PLVKSGLAFAPADANPALALPKFFGAVTNIRVIDEAAKGVGGMSVGVNDTTGVVRRLPMLFSDGTHVYPSLVVEALRVALRQRSIAVRSAGSSGDAFAAGRHPLIDFRVGEGEK